MTASAEDVRRTLRLDRRRGVRRVVILIALLAVAAGGVFVMRRRAGPTGPRYRTETVKRSDLRVTVSATGKLQGLNTVEVGAEVTGKVLFVKVDYNDKVTRGQLLAEIDPEQLRAAADEARAQLLSAESNIKTAQATVLETRQTRERIEEQSKLGLISQKEREGAVAASARAEASLSSAQASAELARATLKSAQSRLAKTKIYSPIDGIVLGRSVEPGQTVTAGFQTPVLFKLAEDLRKLSLHVDIDEADVGRVREGMEATFTVDTYPERVFSSRVLSLRNDPKTSQNVVTYEAVLAVDNTDLALRPGMTATASITSELLHDVVAVPNAALRFVPPSDSAKAKVTVAPPKSRDKTVYLSQGPTLTPVTVKLGPSDGHASQLLDGALTPGTEVVIDVEQK